MRGLSREDCRRRRRSCSPSCRPSLASPPRAAPCRRSPASSSSPPAAASSCARPTWRSASASRSRPRSTARAPSCCRRGCCSTSSAQLPGDERHARAARRRAGRRGRLAARRGSTCARCAPRTSRRCPSPAATQVVTVPAAAFVETIAKVARSASRDETRPILTGILVSAPASELRMVATDSYRLSVKETTLEPPLEGGFEANVPARALQELERLVGARRRRADPHRRAHQPGRLRGRRQSCCRRD